MPWWIWATYYSAQHNKQQESFTGPFPTEMASFQWGTKKFATVPGATFKPVFSKSVNRDTARNEHRFSLGESGERGNMPDVLDIRFRNFSKEE